MTTSQEKVDNLLQELVDGQKKKLLRTGQRIVSNLTPDDLLQPNDFPELENHPDFRYEEGILHGLQIVEMALRSQLVDVRD